MSILLIGALLVFVIIHITKNGNNIINNDASDVEWSRYTKDTYKNWILKWQYTFNYNHTFDIVNISAVCKCGCRFIEKSRYGNTYYGEGLLVCSNCNKQYPVINEDEIVDFKLITEHKINTHTYEIQK